jgi:amino acid transporter
MEPAEDRAAEAADSAEPDEAEEEELRERYREVLEEYRTILPGVQVLLAFLLTVPFSQRFEELDDLSRDLFMVAIASTAIAMLLFLTPTAFHRIAPEANREQRVRLAVRATVAGMLAVATSVVTAILVVSRFIYDDTVAAWVTGGILGLAITLWFLLPLGRRLLDARAEGD